MSNKPQSVRVDALDDGFAIPVKVVPGSSRERIAGALQDALRVCISAPPEAGKANKRLVQFLAKSLGLKKTQVAIVSGHTQPRKRVKIVGLTEPQLRARIEALCAQKRSG